MVSSHLPARGGSVNRHVYDVLRAVVSSHLPARGGSRSRTKRRNRTGRFQSPPREGRIRCRAASSSCRHCFQSPPREGRIHARLFPEVNGKLFPVTSPRGEDRGLRPPDLTDPQCFQSPPREGRIVALGLGVNPAHVSFPVTSPRGEDRHWRVFATDRQGFQSPPREGRIKQRTLELATLYRFQSPPREGRICCGRADKVAEVWFPVTSPRGEDPSD